MILDMAPERRRFDWVKIQKFTKKLGTLAIVFAAGGWVVSIRAQEARLPYLQRATHQQERVVAVAGPNPVATIKCERKRADVAATVADQSVAISNFTAVPEDILNSIPNCPKGKVTARYGSAPK